MTSYLGFTWLSARNPSFFAKMFDWQTQSSRKDGHGKKFILSI
jgi:hypothetical protein